MPKTTRTENLILFKTILAETLDIAPDTVTEESTFETLALDSLDIVEVLCAVEDELGMELDLDTADAGGDMTLGDLLDAIG